ncbi:unnamed protein product [Bursaphelenchus xylophilus]|uniref:(pine wood nematode) hypothetical protein n=1 Tax=Bursaphelenchus xylophilus TaxID=6326 RepID=A0A1I7SWM8_BURXY|nr:unnamed protein product [Bursaphelenchus xylophilus]CAG9099680.1 unnamed protein product [Bursaphelenchus xylophilus]
MSKKSKKSQKSRKSQRPTPESDSTNLVAQKPSKSQLDYIVASMYFLDWNKSILEAYTHNVKELYLVPLTEHCLRKKVMIDDTLSGDDSGKSAKTIEAGRKLEQGVKVEAGQDELKNLQRRLRNEYEVPKDGNTEESGDYIPVKKEKWTSLAEISVMYRLRTLIQMCGSLLIFMTKIRSWLEKHRKIFSQYGKECGEVLDYTLICFEAVCCQADIFSLNPVERDKVREDCRNYIVMEDPYKGEENRKREIPLTLKQHVKEEVKILEAKINYYRASVSLIANSLTDITQAIGKKIPREILAVTTKEVKMILEKLPPAYYFPAKFEFSAGTHKILERHPPNRRRLLKQDDLVSIRSDSSRSAGSGKSYKNKSGKSRQSQKSTKRGHGSVEKTQASSQMTG